MDALVAFYSRTGNNRLLAERLAGGLRCPLCPILPRWRLTTLAMAWSIFRHSLPKLQPRTLSAAGFAHVVLVAPLWAGRIATPMKSYVEQEGRSFRHYSFATLSGGYELASQVEAITQELSSLTGGLPQQVLELRVSDLLEGSARRQIRVVSRYRVKESELGRFQAQIDAFTEGLVQAA